MLCISLEFCLNKSHIKSCSVTVSSVTFGFILFLFSALVSDQSTCVFALPAPTPVCLTFVLLSHSPVCKLYSVCSLSLLPVPLCHSYQVAESSSWSFPMVLCSDLFLDFASALHFCALAQGQIFQCFFASAFRPLLSKIWTTFPWTKPLILKMFELLFSSHAWVPLSCLNFTIRQLHLEVSSESWCQDTKDCKIFSKSFSVRAVFIFFKCKWMQI